MAECTYCGGFVTDDYARVFGDNENRVDDCRNCPTPRPTQGQEEADDDREVLLREVDETATREQRESSDRDQSSTTDRDQPSTTDRAQSPTTDRAEADGAGTEGDEERDRGRLQSGLDAVVSALRS